MSDSLKKYLFSDRSVRVQTVRLEQAWQQAQQDHHYPDAIRNILGELTAAAVLLASNLKFEGSLIMQIQGDGPVALLVVECDHLLNIRTSVKLREQHITAEDFPSLVNAHGNGRFVLILMQADTPPYQGIVGLDGNSPSEVLQSYMKQSEQLDTILHLAADRTQACGLLLQRLPHHGGTATQNASSWERASMLVQTLNRQELLELSSETIIHRLFWQEDLIALEEQSVTWQCTCSRERVANMLISLGEAEVHAILQEQADHHIEIKCDFCCQAYSFDEADCKTLFESATRH